MSGSVQQAVEMELLKNVGEFLEYSLSFVQNFRGKNWKLQKFSNKI